MPTFEVRFSKVFFFLILILLLEITIYLIMFTLKFSMKGRIGQMLLLRVS